jgi:hypothetical protein
VEAKVWQIETKVRKSDFDQSRLSDFRCRVEATADARIILDRPEITLYCLDDDSRQAVFLEGPPGVDLSQQPFYFLHQFNNAQRMYTTTFEVLQELGTAMGNRFKTFIPMYTVGRCGGTLLSRAFNRMDTVHSLDEPDVYSRLAGMRPTDGSRDSEVTQIIVASTRLLFKPMKPKADTLFIKFRPGAPMEVGDLIYKAFPQSKAMFLYRNAETWARSWARAVESMMENRADTAEDDGDSDNFFRFVSLFDLSKSAAKVTNPPRQKPKQARAVERAKFAKGLEWMKRSSPLLLPYIRRSIRDQLTAGDLLKLISLMAAQHIPGLSNRCQTPGEFVQPYIRAIPPIKMLGIAWLSMMHRYLKLHGDGIPILGIQYETLIASPLAVLQGILEYCGLPIEQAAVAIDAFAEDSQKGSPLSRERLSQTKLGELSPEVLAHLHEVLREYPPVVIPDFVVPNSLDIKKKQ